MGALERGGGEGKVGEERERTEVSDQHLGEPGLLAPPPAPPLASGSSIPPSPHLREGDLEDTAEAGPPGCRSLPSYSLFVPSPPAASLAPTCCPDPFPWACHSCSVYAVFMCDSTSQQAGACGHECGCGSACSQTGTSVHLWLCVCVQGHVSIFSGRGMHS